jgi:hypothetical protein
MKPLVALALLIFPAVGGCQQLPPLDVLLDRLDAYATQYQATLPSLSCDEEILSQSLNKKGKVTWEVKMQSTLREIRKDDPYDPFVEKREIKSIKGRRSRRMPPMPYFVEGGFAGLVGFKRWEQRECFEYRLTSDDNGQTVRLEMGLKAKPSISSCAKLPSGFRRVVVTDPKTGRILHTERTIAPEEAEMSTEVYFGGIDYAPQQLGDQTFWLPSRFYAHDATDRHRMIATYSNCHRYTGELKILPEVSPAGAVPQSH